MGRGQTTVGEGINEQQNNKQQTMKDWTTRNNEHQKRTNESRMKTKEDNERMKDKSESKSKSKIKNERKKFEH